MTWELLKAVRLNFVFIFVRKAVCLSNTAKRFLCREEGTLQIKALGTTRKTERSRRSSARRLRAPVTQMHSGTLGKIAIDAIAQYVVQGKARPTSEFGRDTIAHLSGAVSALYLPLTHN